MPVNFADIPVDAWLGRPSPDRIQALREFLVSQGTFRFPALKTGLFSAAAFESTGGDVTGYQSVWTRDTVHVAHAQWATGNREPAVQAMTALGEFYVRSRSRFLNCIAQPGLAADPMQRPHIRFDGNLLQELPEKWSHAQNDALGYWLWLTCKLVLAEDLTLTLPLADILSLLVHYWTCIEFWKDEDSGHWEETRKVAASSVGVAVAGLKAFREVIELHSESFTDRAAIRPLLDALIQQGVNALRSILPAECVTGEATQLREHDAALLFLIYPTEAVSGDTAMKIIHNVRQHLAGPLGIRRYNGDSYWCANYKQLLSAEIRTSDFSDDLTGRDQLLVPGTEAQWCIFDPILSVIYGRRFLELGDPADRDLQWHYLQRSFHQLTNSDSRFGPYRCPESYYLENGVWGPNDICPLLWTQANLWLALYWAEQTA